MALNFERFAQEGNAFINELAEKLNHPDSKDRVGILLRSVLHVLRERITMQQSFHLIEQLPMFLKGVYVEQWKYREEPMAMDTLEEFCKAVEREQSRLGEQSFDWKISTEALVKSVIEVLSLRYISAGEISDIVGELPAELKQVFEGQEVA